MRLMLPSLPAHNRLRGVHEPSGKGHQLPRIIAHGVHVLPAPVLPIYGLTSSSMAILEAVEPRRSCHLSSHSGMEASTYSTSYPVGHMISDQPLPTSRSGVSSESSIALGGQLAARSRPRAAVKTTPLAVADPQKNARNSPSSVRPEPLR